MILFINILLFVLGFAVVTKSSIAYIDKKSLFHKKVFYLFLILHFGIAFFHWYWSLENGRDTVSFYNKVFLAQGWLDFFHPGSKFISFLIYPIVKLGVSYFILFFMFSVISFYGFLNYFRLLNSHIKNKSQQLLYFLFLLPSFQFWSAPISKDSLVFFLMSVLLIYLKKSNYLMLMLIFIAIGFIRPHIVVMLIFAFVLILLLEKKLDKKNLFLAVLGFIIGGYVMFKFIRLSSFSFEAIQIKLEQFNNYSIKSGNSHIDLFTTSYAERIFALLFRPLFIDASTVFQFFASVENIIVLLTLAYLFVKHKLRFRSISIEAKYSLIVSVLLLLLISTYIYNLGLGSRMRLMIYPYLIYGLCLAIEEKNVYEEKAN